MRIVLAALLAALIAVTVPLASAATDGRPAGTDKAIVWIKAYRAHPQPLLVPELVRGLSRAGAFQEPDAAGIYVGFVAGVLGSNPRIAATLVREMSVIPPADQWFIVKAIAYSRLGGWRYLMRLAAPELPTRQVMIDAYLTGKLPDFDAYRPEPEKPSWLQRVGRALKLGKTTPQPAVLEPSPFLLDMFWGYYFATGKQAPLDNIADLLPWSQDHNDVAHLTIGSMAEYTIAANSSRDLQLLAAVKRVRKNVGGKIAPILDKAIFAAETSETEKLRDNATQAINDLRLKGPQYKRNVTWWGQAGEGAIALGCVVAAVTGQVQLGVPCVITGAATTAALHYFASQS